MLKYMYTYKRTCSLIITILVLFIAYNSAWASSESTSPNQSSESRNSDVQVNAIKDEAVNEQQNPGKWAIEIGAAVIAKDNVHSILYGQFDREDGPAGGEIYKITGYYTLKVFDWELWGSKYYPQVEIPLAITMFDENDRRPYMNYNAAIGIRWTDFPWNKILYTTIATSGGLGYFEKIPAIDILKHPDDDRSHVKFWWPFQITFALPHYKNHQIVFYDDHWSGGHIFDAGGFDSFGIGYRYIF